MAATNESVPSSPAGVRAWVSGIAWRASWLYLAFYCLASWVQMAPLVGPAWHGFVSWVGAHVFHVSVAVSRPTGSGDGAFNYLELAVQALLAVVVAVAWTLSARGRAVATPFPDPLRILVRYAVFWQMAMYGVSKVLLMQFPSPSTERLLQPYGESSPMGLLWTFMGYSPAYQFFGGAAEVVGGVLLLFRRTATLGALVVAGVMTNVVMLNFCYDVPVKIHSSHLLLLALWLVGPDVRRLIDVLVLNRPTEPVAVGETPGGRPGRYGARALKALLILGMVGGAIAIKSLPRTTTGSVPEPLLGAYRVESFRLNDRDATPDRRWHDVIVERGGWVTVVHPSGKKSHYTASVPTSSGKLTLKNSDGFAPPSELTFKPIGADGLTLEGTLDGQRARMSFKKRDQSGFLLMNRGFRWVSEAPFNR